MTIYDKRKLFPFYENNFTAGTNNVCFSISPKEKSDTLSTFYFCTHICFESTLPHAIRDQVLALNKTEVPWIS